MLLLLFFVVAGGAAAAASAAVCLCGLQATLSVAYCCTVCGFAILIQTSWHVQYEYIIDYGVLPPFRSARQRRLNSV